MGLYVGFFKLINGLCKYVLFIGKLPPTTKVDVEDGKGIDTNIGGKQDHNIRKSLSISKVQFDSRSDSKTLGDMEVLSTYVTHPCDRWELYTMLTGYTTIDVKVIVLDSQPQPNL